MNIFRPKFLDLYASIYGKMFRPEGWLRTIKLIVTHSQVVGKTRITNSSANYITKRKE